MVTVEFNYILDTGQEMKVEAEVSLEPKTQVPYVSWDDWTIDGKDVLETDDISDIDKEKIHQQIMDAYEIHLEVTHNT